MFTASLQGFVYAQENPAGIEFERVNPDKTTRYKLKRLSEKITLTRLNLMKSKNIGNFYLDLVEKRGKELIYINQTEKLAYLESTTSRYITYVGLFTETYDNNKEGIDVNRANRILSQQKELFMKEKEKYEYGSSQWLLVQQAIETADVLQSKIKS